MAEDVRIDKWLWAVRVFKTRSMATDACRSGKVKIDSQVVKPSHDVKIGETIIIVINPHFTRTMKVLEGLSNRVSAKLVPQFAEDLTPPEEYDKLKRFNEHSWELRDRGIGRPTKKERRLIDKLKETRDEELDW
jgi:ribosome-associated heat shock protein Hsp15